MHTDDPVLDLMDRFTAALNSHDLDAVAALVTEDIVLEATSPPPDGTRYEGRDAVRRIWAEMLATTPQAGRVPARLLEPATSVTGTARLLLLLVGAGLGAVSGVLTGVIAVVVSRRLTS